MLTTNRYLDFANELIAKYSGQSGAFEQASLIYPQEEKAAENEAVQAQHNFVNNFYKIQNIREENYLYTKNLTFLTEIMEKRFFQKIYPSVEKQVEKAVREEFHQAENHTVEKFAKMIQKYVEREGAEKLTFLKEHFQSTEHLIEKNGHTEHDVLFRKLENIYQSSVYQPQNVEYRTIHQKNHFQKNDLWQNQTLVYPTVEEASVETAREEVSHTELLEKWTNTLIKEEIYRETKKQLEKQFHGVSHEILKERFQELISQNVTNEIVRQISDAKQFVDYQVNELTKNILNNYQTKETKNQKNVWNLQTLQKQQNQIHVQKNHLFHQSIEQEQQINLKQNIQYQNPETVLNYQTEETIQNIENVQTEKAETLIQQNVSHRQETTKIDQLGQEIQILQEMQNLQEVQNQKNVWNLQTLQEQQNQIHVQKNQLLHQSIEQGHQINVNQKLHHQMEETVLNYQTEENVQNIENVLEEKASSAG